MNSLVLFLGVALFALCEAHPAEHRVTGKLVTHIHKFKEEVPAKDKNGPGLKSNCQKGALVGVDRGLERGISDVTAHGNLLGVAGDAVDHVGHAAQGLVDNVDHGLGNGIDDLACGVGKIADEAASAIQTGNLVGGVADIAGTAVTSVADTLGALVGGAAGGIGSVVGNAVGLLADL